MSNKIKLSDVQRIHMIGIGGIGMSALARLFLNEKKQVSGSDATMSPITDALQEAGVVVHASQVAENITEDIDLVVYTEAMSHHHEEMAAAHAQSIPMMNYFEALALSVNDYFLIAVAGTHGKTTTTAMLVDVFETANLDPTAVIGSLRTKTQSNFRAGKSKYAIVEACEYRRDFLYLEPDVLVITNLEHEHVDYYPDLAAVQHAFAELVAKVDERGAVVANTDDPALQPVLQSTDRKIVPYQKYIDVTRNLKVPGLHNQQNAAAAAAVAGFCSVPEQTVQTALEAFAGTWRRFEYKGEVNGASVFDDYAHHPTAIKATIAATKELFPDKRVVVVFQPHTYSRTKQLFTEFAWALAGADRIIITPIYAAREDDIFGVSSRDLLVKVTEYNPEVSYGATNDAVVAHLQETVTKDDVVLIMGAGTVTEVAQAVVR